MEEKTKIWNIAAAVVIGIVIGGALTEAFFSVAIPIGVAYIAARLSRPVGVRISRGCRISEKTGCTAYAVILCAAGIYLVTLASGKLAKGLKDLSLRLPELADNAGELVSKIYDMIPFLKSEEIGPLVSGALKEGAAYLGSAAAEFFGDFFGKLPGGAVSLMFAVVSFVYLTADLPGAGASIRKILPASMKGHVLRLFCDAESAVFSYLKTSLILMSVTFFELLVGLSILGVSSPFAMASLIAVIDALPVLGCGTVLVPYAVWSLYVGDYGKAVGILCLLFVIYMVRQFLEPRLIGKITGVHPFVALLFMFCGWKLGGVGGLILAPIVLLITTDILEGREEKPENKKAGRDPSCHKQLS